MCVCVSVCAYRYLPDHLERDPVQPKLHAAHRHRVAAAKAYVDNVPTDTSGMVSVLSRLLH